MSAAGGQPRAPRASRGFLAIGLVSIGEFSRLSRLSPKALRLYDEFGLLVPDHVDPATGYRWYADTQLDQARVVALLRRIGVPLAQIRDMLALDPVSAAGRVLLARPRRPGRRDRGRVPRSHAPHGARAPGGVRRPRAGPGYGITKPKPRSPSKPWSPGHRSSSASRPAACAACWSLTPLTREPGRAANSPWYSAEPAGSTPEGLPKQTT